MKHILKILTTFVLALGFMQQVQPCPMTIHNTSSNKLFLTMQKHGDELTMKQVKKLKKAKQGFIVKAGKSKKIGTMNPNQQTFIYSKSKNRFKLVHKVTETFCAGHATINYSDIQAKDVPHEEDGKKRYVVEEVSFYQPGKLVGD